MELGEVANIGEAIGGVAVLVTRVILVIETRSNTRALKASLTNELNASLASFNENRLYHHEERALILRSLQPGAKRCAVVARG